MKNYIAVFMRYRHLLQNLISRDLKVKYRRSALGFLWSILNPLLMMIVISSVFQFVMRFDTSQIKDYAIFYLTGALIFNFVSEATSMSLPAIVNGASLIKKVYIPKYIFPMEKTLFAFVNMLLSMIALVIMLIVRQSAVTWIALLFPIPLIYVLFFAMGFSFMLSSLDVFFRDVEHLYSVWVTAWMYISPVIYSVSMLPEWMQPIMKINPLYHYITYFRNLIIDGVFPGLTENLICIGLSLFFFTIGILIFKKTQDKFILYI